MNLYEMISEEANSLKGIPELGGRNLKPVLDYWGGLEELKSGLGIIFQSDSGACNNYLVYWMIISILRNAYEDGMGKPGRWLLVSSSNRG